jgi:hypothetical protein
VGVPSVTASFASSADFRPERYRLLAGVTAATASLATSAVGNDPHPRSSVVIHQAAWDYRDQYQELTGTSLTECPACQRGRMVLIEVLKPAKPWRPIYDTS